MERGATETEVILAVETANEQLTAGDDGKFVFVNDLNGERSELKVA